MRDPKILRATLWGFLFLLFPFLSLQAHTNNYRILVFSKTAGYRHSSIPNGIAMIQALGTNHHFAVDLTEDAADFTDANLAQYQAVVFLSTTGDVLNTNQQAAFERFIQAGNGYVGIHAASDTEYSWPWYGQLVGAYFQDHPDIEEATIIVADRFHPSTAPLPERWVRTDEWYNFRSNPRGQVHVLATLDERSYWGGSMGFDHPTAWCHDFDGGRAWYTGGGHTEESYAEPLFQAHVLGGIEYAAGIKKADAGATINSNFQLRVLDTGLTQPMSLAVAPDGRVFYIERRGRLKVFKPDTSTPVVAGMIPVFHELEDGLLGIALDPGFATNHWLYLMYSPSNSVPRQLVSRFTMAGDFLELASEKVLLEIPTQREECCHSAGSLAFGPDGNLYISTGDNTEPFSSESFSPLDERSGRSAWDAQKSSSNANDLRGKILRIRPEPDGTYSIPPGNLFPPNTPLTKPEIYVMGGRNPFRISVDAETGWLYWGDVGPDAHDADINRGPMGYDEINQTRSAGNYGWPYFVANNQAYREYNFASGVPGPFFDPNFPTNNSPNSTGLQSLPPARPAWIWYPYGPSMEFPELDVDIEYQDFRAVLAGPVYHFNANLVSGRKLPAYYDRTLFIYDLARLWIKEVKVDSSGNVLKINPFLPHLPLTIMDMETGPDGVLYLLDWTSNRLSRIEYVAGDYAPVAVATANPSFGSVPLTVQFSSAGSSSLQTSQALNFAWSFLGNGVIDSTNPTPLFIYTEPGQYNAQLTVTDVKGNQAVANISIVAGNNQPTVTIEEPPNGAFFDWGNPIRFRARVNDVEDGTTTNGTISCNRLGMEISLGHNEHAHSQGQIAGCEGILRAPDFDASEVGNLFLQLEAAYTDDGVPGVTSLSGFATHVLHPRRIEAENFNQHSGIIRQATQDPQGGLTEVAGIDHGDWISFAPINLTNIHTIYVRVASSVGGQIELHLDGINGPIISAFDVPPTGGAYTNLVAGLDDPGGTRELYFVFRNAPGSSGLFVLNWLEFEGAGVNLPAFLQSAATPAGTFSDDVNGIVNFGAKTFTVPIINASRFYRLRSATDLKIQNIRIEDGQAVISYR